MANACPSGSLPTVGRGWALPSSHNTGKVVLLGGHPESVTVVSAKPATSPRLLISLADPLFPPSVGRALMWPFCQRNGRHVFPVPKPQKSSPSGSGTAVSAIPTACPWSLIPPQFIQVLSFGPPSVPRSILNPLMFITARPFTRFAASELLTGSKIPSWTNVQP